MPAVSVAGRLLRRWEWTSFRVGVLVILVATLIVRAWSVSRWTWVDDDWVYMARTQSMGFFEYLFQNYNGHLMPGEFLIAWAVTDVAPLTHGLAVVLTTAAALLSVAVWAVALREMFGERIRLLFPLAILALSPMVLRPTIWWASALQALPLQFFLGLCVFFASRLARRLDRGSLVGLLGSYTLALFFWEKALLLAIPITAVLAFSSLLGVLATARRHWPALAGLVVIGGTYLGIFRVLTAVGTGEREMGVSLSSGRSFGEGIALFGQAAGDLLLPAMLGGPWGTLPTDSDKYSGPTPVAVFVCAALVLSVCVLSLLYRRRAWQPLAMVILYAVVSWSLVLFSNRFDLMPGVAINDERYSVDTLVVACLVLAMLITPVSGEGDSAAFRHHPRLWLGSRVLHVVVGVGLAVSLVGANIVAIDRLGTHPGKLWLLNLREDVDRLAPVSIHEAYAPESVLFPGLWADSARLSRMLSPLGRSIEIDGPAESLYVVLPNGHLRPAAIGDASHSAPGPVNGCGYAVGQGTPQDVQMTRDLYDFEWGLQVDTLAGGGGTLRVEIGGKSIDMKIGKGLRRTQAVFTGPVTDARLSVTGKSGTICVADLVVGTITPAPPD